MSAATEVGQLSGWQELAAGIYVQRCEPESVNIGLIVGTEGALIVDTGSSPAQGQQLRDSIQSVTELPLIAAVVTHAHYDHAHGLEAFADLQTIAHDGAGLALPNKKIAVAMALDLGERRVEIAHLGRGHTEGDLVVVVPDADLFFAGDLLESAGPPCFGDDSVPDEWAATLDGLIGLMTAATRAVPGHGEPVDREFVFNQRGEIAAVVGEIRRLFDEGITEEKAVAEGSWPYPGEHVAEAVRSGFAVLQKTAVAPARPNLPLV